jgi:hypothetical protein
MINRQECICLVQDSKRILLQNKKAARVLPYFLDGTIIQIRSNARMMV